MGNKFVNIKVSYEDGNKTIGTFSLKNDTVILEAHKKNRGKILELIKGGIWNRLTREDANTLVQLSDGLLFLKNLSLNFYGHRLWATKILTDKRKE